MSLPYRTGKTWLSDDELILLDVLFRGSADFRLLRGETFHDQWYLGYSHSLDDAALKETLTRLYRSEVLSLQVADSRTRFRMTETGSDLWSRERCPVWERYCCDQNGTTTRGLSRMSVVAVSAVIRDEFLSYELFVPIRRRSMTILDRGLLYWRSFGRLYVRVETFDEKHEWTPEECAEWQGRLREHYALIEEKRSWWRTVSELQRFVS